MRTTLTISDAILERLKGRAASERRPFKQVVEDCLALGLERLEDGTGRLGEGECTYSAVVHNAGLQTAVDPLKLNILADQLDDEADAL